MNEFFLPKPNPEFYGYTHSFKRYFDHGGLRVDKLALVQQHGIVSPRKAEKLGIPHEVNARITMVGVNDYDDIIFLFPIKDEKIIPHGPGEITVLIDPRLPILTPEEMAKKYEGRWVVLSRMWGGEVYTFGQISQDLILNIKGI